MRRLAILLGLLPSLALAQSLPAGVPGTVGYYYGYLPNAAQQNQASQAKQDWIGLNPRTVSTLPTCNATTQYHWAVVTDATTPTYNGALTGSGAVIVPVFCDGTAWKSH